MNNLTIVDLVRNAKIYPASGCLLDAVAEMPVYRHDRFYWTVVPINSDKYELFAKGPEDVRYYIKRRK
jgi:hypothetical protein